MLVNKFIVVAFAALAQALPHPEALEGRSGGVCISGIYAELSVLSAYPIAQAFCTAYYPLSCTSI